MHGKFSESFPDYTIFIDKFTTDECFLFKLEIFKICKEVKHIMIMIKAVIYIFLNIMWYLMNSWKLLSKNPQTPKKILSHLFTQFPLKDSKNVSPLFFGNIEIFLGPPAEMGKELCGSDRKSSSNPVKSKSINQSKIFSKFQRCIKKPVENISFCPLNCKKSSNVDVWLGPQYLLMLFLCFYGWLWANFVHWFSCIFDMFHKHIFHCF